MVKTSDLQALSASQISASADSILVDDASSGTGRVSFAEAVEFFKDTFLAGGVPYGKNLIGTGADQFADYAALRTAIAAGNFSKIHIGDYLQFTLTAGTVTNGSSTKSVSSQTVIAEVAGIDQYYKCGDTAIAHHVDFISRDCLAETFQYNPTNNNNGTSTEPNPYRASTLFQTLNGTSNSLVKLLPSALQSVIIEKRALLESRYSAGGTITEATTWAWNNMGKLWLPTEVEVFGHSTFSDKPWGTGGGGCNLQYPIFQGGAKHIIKGAGNGGSRGPWWEASARSGNATYFCHVGRVGHADYSIASNAFYVPLCFRIA